VAPRESQNSSARLRAGRFERRITINAPDRQGRLKILQEGADEARRALAEDRAQLDDLAHVLLERETLDVGSRPATVVGLRDADLLVVGASRRSDVDRRFNGDDTREVLEGAGREHRARTRRPSVVAASRTSVARNHNPIQGGPDE
jgi:SpoVK/Ycf46/Vps4 family AAA+-type ATPase